jgi:hypothetical protein
MFYLSKCATSFWLNTSEIVLLPNSAVRSSVGFRAKQARHVSEIGQMNAPGIIDNKLHLNVGTKP